MSAPGYMGCWTCGKLTACAEMKRVTVVYHGRELSTPGYECARCDGASSLDVLEKTESEFEDIRVYMGIS